MNRPESHWLAAELLLIGAARHHLWPLFPVDAQGMASKMFGAAFALVLLSALQRLAWRAGLGSFSLACVLLTLGWYQASALLCSAAWLIDPWPIIAGQGVCTGRIGFDLGAAGLVALAAVAYLLLPVRFDTKTRTE